MVCRKEYLQKTKPARLLKAQQYKEENKTRLAILAKQYAEENSKAIAARRSAHRAKNKTRVAKKEKEYRTANTTKIKNRMSAYRERNKDVLLLQGREYTKKNPVKVRAKCAKRRATKLQRTPLWYSSAAVAAIYKELKPGYHIDHIVPLQGEFVSGLHWAHNLQMLPASANCSKGNKFNPDTYVHELPIY
jgi:hypothetical protein